MTNVNEENIDKIVEPSKETIEVTVIKDDVILTEVDSNENVGEDEADTNNDDESKSTENSEDPK